MPEELLAVHRVPFSPALCSFLPISTRAIKGCLDPSAPVAHTDTFDSGNCSWAERYELGGIPQKLRFWKSLHSIIFPLQPIPEPAGRMFFFIQEVSHFLGMNCMRPQTCYVCTWTPGQGRCDIERWKAWLPLVPRFICTTTLSWSQAAAECRGFRETLPLHTSCPWVLLHPQLPLAARAHVCAIMQKTAYL